jgi:hypothetical protein
MMVYPRGVKDHKNGWLVHTKNITKDQFFNFVGVTDVWKMNTLEVRLLERLFTNHTDKVDNKTLWECDDRKRPLFMDEYMDLAFALKKQGLRYNKKTDKLTTYA